MRTPKSGKIEYVTGDDDAHVAMIVANNTEYSKQGQQYSKLEQQWIQPVEIVQAVVVSTVVATLRIEAIAGPAIHPVQVFWT